jgi:acetolactate synthase-1/2/3 large subunit
MGLGAYPAPDPQWLGMLGMHGTRTANYAMDEADLICAIGARFDDRITGKLSEFAPNAKFIHIDIDPAEISKNVPAHIPIVGDAKHVLKKLNTEYSALKADKSRTDDWWEQIRSWQKEFPIAFEETEGTEIKPQRAIADIFKAVGPDAIVSTDIGQHQMWTAQYFDFAEPRKWIQSGGLGTMGFGLPAAMGAKVGAPEETVICIAGDGSVQMNMQELSTCSTEGIAVKIFIINNGYLGMVRQWQELFWDKRYSAVDMRPPDNEWPDFVKLAEAHGATAFRFDDKTSLIDDIKKAVATPGPVVCDIRVTREENVYPMIAPGQAARDMVG